MPMSQAGHPICTHTVSTPPALSWHVPRRYYRDGQQELEHEAAAVRSHVDPQELLRQAEEQAAEAQVRLRLKRQHHQLPTMHSSCRLLISLPAAGQYSNISPV